jgi:NADH-quinone oxidoreductase subunit G
MGTTGRGENMEVGTYIEHSVDHELSANIIDLCPVGALNNKPFRYHARAWEMTQHALVSPHDAFGTNLYAHVLRGKLMRMVPRENEEINETWIADRDRFGFEGMYSAERVSQPMLRIDGVLQAVDWEVALNAAAEGLQKAGAARGAAGPGFLASPSATLEEMYLLAQIARGLGSANIDHRLRQLDFRAQQDDPAFPSLGLKIAEVERLEGVLVVGSNLRHEMPLLAHRIRKAAVRQGGAKVAFLNPRRFDYMFPVAAYAVVESGLVGELAAVVRATAAALDKPVPAGAAVAEVHDSHRALAAALLHGSRRAVILGTLAQRHPAYAELTALAAMLGELCGASVGCITEGANAAGAYLAGAVPHRESGGAPAATVGLSARAMLEAALPAHVLFGGIDPAVDCAESRALGAGGLVIAITTHLPESLRAIAHVVLPIATFAETSGTFVNAEGRWQSWPGAAKLPGDSRPGWKVLRVLANLLNLHGVDYVSSDEVRDALKTLCGARAEATGSASGAGTGAAVMPQGQTPSGPWMDIPPYQADALVRGSEALSKTKDGRMTRTVI